MTFHAKSNVILNFALVPLNTNELTHDYDCEIVKTHCSTIVEKYIDLFYDFEKVVKQLEM